jgi:hypothetical protein
MAKKKSSKKQSAKSTKKSSSKSSSGAKKIATKKTAAKKPVARAKAAPAKTASAKAKKPARKIAAKSAARTASRPKPATRRPHGKTMSTLGGEAYETETPVRGRGLGAASAGQSGDIQGISRAEEVDSESVEELTEEGQDFEAEVVSGVESALDPDEGEVHTHEVPEDDVPEEYQNPDK